MQSTLFTLGSATIHFIVREDAEFNNSIAIGSNAPGAVIWIIASSSRTAPCGASPDSLGAHPVPTEREEPTTIVLGLDAGREPLDDFGEVPEDLCVHVRGRPVTGS